MGKCKHVWTFLGEYIGTGTETESKDPGGWNSMQCRYENGTVHTIRESKHTVRVYECIQCRECESKCTQQIPISEWMPVVHAVLGEGKAYEEVEAP